MIIDTHHFVDLAANETFIQDTTGNSISFLACNDQDALFEVRAYDDKTGERLLNLDMLPGQNYPLPPGHAYKRVEMVNRSGGTVTGKFVLGTGVVQDNRVNGQVQTAKSGIFNALAPLTMDGQVQTVPANVARTSLAIYAPATNAGNVWIGQTNQGIPLPPGGSFVLPTTAAITLQGATGLKVYLVEV